MYSLAIPSARPKNAAYNAASEARRCFGWVSGSEVGLHVGLECGGKGKGAHMVMYFVPHDISNTSGVLIFERHRVLSKIFGSCFI
jgi:hypothetical protein